MKLRKGVQHRRATFTLHRYFLWANRMRTHFDDLLKKRIQRTAMGEKADQFYIEETMYMSYWYGGLYVVIEGWKQLGLSDPAVDTLLRSRNVALLKRYRDGVYHFQPEYYDERFMAFIVKGEHVAQWVRTLNAAIGAFFLRWFETNKSKRSR